MFYAKTLGNKILSKFIFMGFGIIIVANILIVLLLHLIR